MGGPRLAPDEPGSIELGTGRWIPESSRHPEVSASPDRSQAPRRQAPSGDPFEQLVLRILVLVGVACVLALLVVDTVLVIARLGGGS